MQPDPKVLLRAMFDAAIARAMPDKCVPPFLPEPPKGRTIVVGAGKAAATMAKAVEEHWPGELSGLVVTRYGHHASCRSRWAGGGRAHPPDGAGAG
jgi:glycerate 2-kinase